MSSKTLPLTVLLLWLGLSSIGLSNASPQNFESASAELISVIEKHDDDTKKKAKEWQKIAQALQDAAKMAETAAGFRVSAQGILSHWTGLGLRIVDDTQAEYYALHPQHPPVFEVGAWFARRGARWYVKQVSARPGQALHRGDAISQKDFHPVQTWAKFMPEGSVLVQTQALGEPKAMSLRARQMGLPRWALEETQSASTVLMHKGKRLCQEKLWLWLNPEIGSYLVSKLGAARDNCQALLLDLRDSSGLTSITLPKKPEISIPLVVLVNEDTRMDAVALAQSLHDQYDAAVFGEPTGTKLHPDETLALAKIPWILLISRSNQGSLLPDQIINDDWMYAAGWDGVKEKAISYLKSKLD